jgi:predicted dehydrogenase/threonine dehydrogenase-like Zn-dependent dehydrogenase
MKQVLIRRGQVAVEAIPAPMVESGTVLVRVEHSCISVGTELSGMRASGEPLWRRAIRQPDKVRRVAGVAASQGVGAARDLVNAKLAAGEPTGYSAAGTIVELGDGVHGLHFGQRVACAGAQAAHHAELIRVPRNLVVPVPDGLTSGPASTVTLGAIALQGVRRAVPTMGETFVVIGLGILGQLTAQLLRANGCRVIGSDVDPSRIELARALGMPLSVDPAGGSAEDQVRRMTDGVGADGVIVTAATPSSELISTAFRMCRRKGRVVVVGDVGLDLRREDLYRNELDLLISTSYGPGRYDPAYEEGGHDYPIGYVRWTENRNMAEYLRLVAEGTVRIDPLIGAIHPLGDAAAAYASLSADGAARPLCVLLAYPAEGEDLTSTASRTVPNPVARPPRSGSIGVALVGAGAFAKGMHLPNLRTMPGELHLRAVVSRSGANATATATQFGAAYATTDVAQAFKDPEVGLVIVATRHDLHAGLALDALRHGKHVLVEKPLALTVEELAAFEAFYTDTPDGPILLTGFNRRFSPYGARLAELVGDRTSPMILHYRMNAGYIPLSDWVHGPEGGGRNRGEACHIYDLFTFLTGSHVVDVHAAAIRPRTAHYAADDNFTATMTFEDGSVATLTYTALGSRDHPKERLDVYVDGAVLSLDDYRRLTVSGRRSAGLETSAPAKGQREELAALARAIRDGGPWPIPLWQQVQATEIALAVEPFLTGDR